MKNLVIWLKKQFITISKKLNYTYKKTFLYEQRDKNKQEDFLKEIAKIMNRHIP
ncbi:hypothetical protein SAP269_13770 [Spiroplasma ixodetis]|uniref:Transposase n=1 Tax=Spiroplasma ixodetis TaxID=2141 RepID=A0ABN7BUZ5_9MOLU